MPKPRSIALKLKRQFAPRDRKLTDLTRFEVETAEHHLWFCLMVRSGKERQVEHALRMLGFGASFAPLQARYRRTPGRIKRQTHTHERFNVAAIPGYVFAGIELAGGHAPFAQGLPWSYIANAKAKGGPAGLSHLYGYVSAGSERRPVQLKPASIKALMALSHTPLYRDHESVNPRFYQAADIGDFLLPGSEIEVVQGLLKGQRFVFRRSDGIELVCRGPLGDLRIPAQDAVMTKDTA